MREGGEKERTGDGVSYSIINLRQLDESNIKIYEQELKYII